MLTSEDFKLSMVFYAWLAKMSILPFRFDWRDLTLATRATTHTHKITLAVLSVLLAQTFWLNTRLLYICVNNTISTTHFPVHFSLAIFYSQSCAYYCTSAIKFPTVTIALFNQVYSASRGNRWQLNMLKQARQRWREYNLRELSLMAAPITAVFCACVHEVIYMVDPSFECFSFTLLPNSWQSSTALAICMAVDGTIFFGALCIIQFCLAVEILLFDSLGPFILEHVMPRENLRRTVGADLLQRSRKLTQLILLLRLFNKSRRWSICQSRVSLTIIVIVTGFFGIHRFYGNIVVTVVNLFAVVLTTMSFAIIYDRTFGIPQKISRCKKVLVIGARRLNGASEYEAKIIAATVKSVPALGVDVGCFYRMKRTSTPTFVDFVVRFTARLLLAFR